LGVQAKNHDFFAVFLVSLLKKNVKKQLFRLPPERLTRRVAKNHALSSLHFAEAFTLILLLYFGFN